MMRLVRWRRFQWDLTRLPPLPAALPGHFHLRAATPDEQRAITNVIYSAFSLDMDWSDIFKTFRDRLEKQIEHAFREEPVPAVVATHGVRIIAASVIDSQVDAENNLISGPCVLVEYRNRGIGSALLHHTLTQLQTGGLTNARAVCKVTGPMSKFVYPKFSSTQEAYEFEPSLVGH